MTVRAKLTDRQLQITVRISAAVLDMSGEPKNQKNRNKEPQELEEP